MLSEVTTDLQDFNNQMAAKLQAPVFPTFGGYSCIFAEDSCSLKNRKPVSSFRPLTKFSLRTRLSDNAPVNLFPRTTSNANNYQWPFDTQSAGWEARTWTIPSILISDHVYLLHSGGLVPTPHPKSATRRAATQ